LTAESQAFKVAYVLNRFPAPSQTFVNNEIRALRERGVDLTVFALRPGSDCLEAPAPTVYHKPACNGRIGPLGQELARRLGLEKSAPFEAAWAWYHIEAVRLFAREAVRRGISHVHAHSAWLPAALALLMGRAEPFTVSLTAHARDIFVGGGTFASKLSRCSQCITCTEANAQLLRSMARPADRRKIQRIYHGTDLTRFVYRRAGPSAESTRVLGIGRLVPKKGFETLVRACSLLAKDRALRCEIVGEGPLEARLRRLVAELELDDMVQFTPWVPYDAMPQVYRRAHVLAVPSLQAPDGDRDGLPNVAVEALATGTPVVASAFSALPEAVRHEETGLLCPPGDPQALAGALERIFADSRLRAHVSERGRRLAEERFDYRENAATVLGALRKAARG